MELVTTQQEVYEYHELSDKAKDEVRCMLIQNWETDHIIDFVKADAPKGFYIDDVRYSVTYSQGDGASWTGMINLITYFEAHPDPEFIGEEAIIIELMRNDWIDKEAEVNQNSFHYVDSSTMRLSDVVDYAESVENDSNSPVLAVGILENANVKDLFTSDDWDWAHRLDAMLERALEAVKEYADNIYTQIKEDYEWQVSDENINELIYINGWRFNKRGEII
jgi:hypothetical protein